MSRGARPSGKLAAARVWALPVIWLWRPAEPDPPRVVVVYVSAAGTVLAGRETVRQIGAGRERLCG